MLTARLAASRPITTAIILMVVSSPPDGVLNPNRGEITGYFLRGCRRWLARAAPGYRRVVTQREFEDQPEAPDLGDYVQEDTAETLTGPPNSDALEAGYVPPDRPYALDEPAAAGQADDLDSRLRRERPDVGEAEGSGDSDPERAGRLEPASQGPGGGYDESMDAVEVGISGGAASAEEAAVHRTDEADIGVDGQIGVEDEIGAAGD